MYSLYIMILTLYLSLKWLQFGFLFKMSLLELWSSQTVSVIQQSEILLWEAGTKTISYW